MTQQPPPPYESPGTPQQPNSGKAVTALVLGILGLVMCGPFTAIPAIIVGRNATREIDESQGRMEGRGMAQAGFVLGIVGTVVGGLAVLILVVLLVVGGLVANSVPTSCRTTDTNNTLSVNCD